MFASTTKMKTDLQKGALYLIDDAFRERCRASQATATSLVWTGETATEMGTETDTKYIKNYKPYDNGIVFLADIESHGNTNKSWDICKVLFNNKSGVRFLYREILDLAERLDS